MACDCGILPERWWQDRDTFQRVVFNNHGGRQTEVVQTHGGARANTLATWRSKHQFPTQPPGPRATLPEVEVTVDVKTLGDIGAMLRGRGLDPAEWIVVRCVVNSWDSVAEGSPLPLKQLKVTLRPRLKAGLLTPAATDVRLFTPGKIDKTKPRLVVFVGDEQAPYHDETLHRLFCDWLAVNKPDEAVHLGDLCDFPSISRHRTNPAWNASTQDCINAAYQILHGYRSASPDTRWRALPGNHDERIRDYQLGRAAELYGVRPADIEEELAPSLSLRTLLHLDALGIEWHGGAGDYEHDQVDVTDSLVARHGWITGAGSAEKTVRRLGLNIVVGHTHRQRVHYITEERMRERLTMVCVEAGAMCRVDGGLGYTINPDWQAGAYAATVWPDGSFSGEHLVYRDGALRWRDQRYTA